jgi:hypothetical protein
MEVSPRISAQPRAIPYRDGHSDRDPPTLLYRPKRDPYAPCADPSHPRKFGASFVKMTSRAIASPTKVKLSTAVATPRPSPPSPAVPSVSSPCSALDGYNTDTKASHEVFVHPPTHKPAWAAAQGGQRWHHPTSSLPPPPPSHGRC